MTPYYEDEQSIIYCGDCREVLPQLGPVDLVLTDPPYGINLNTNNGRFSGGYIASIRKRGNGEGTGEGSSLIGDDVPFDPTFLLNYGRAQIIWGWNHFPDKLPRGRCFVWLKRYDEAFASFLSDAELAWVSSGHGVYCRRDLSNNAITNGRQHPTQKPLSLMRWCLDFFPGGVVLDPFMGSGTTLVAAKQLGRKAIGIEISEAYCKVAVERLRQEVLPFTPRVTPTQEQASLWNGSET